ncbi:hypothetical protein JR316_0008703 [Psilocybe cubensis]|uniref:Uncharacterized protein n=2 Tax=Psilocybe cubensis TaxID=181762 RepID=A0A8H7XYC2_PSICU|nr:hypothetical protein JR316_0008703 [Psilocybe cubensis]KAH9478250.1 hypothetical protein JR316_0008703 [Psilocybe cubensis]
MKSDETLNNNTLATIGMALADAETKLKKWVQYYKSIIGSTVVHALKLQMTPEACLTHLLSFTLIPKFTAANPPIRDKDIWTAFRVDNIQVLSFADCIAEKPQLKVKFDEIASRTKNARKENFNAIGFGIVLIEIPCIYTTRFVPYGIPEDLERWDPQWQAKLKMVIERGIAI